MLVKIQNTFIITHFMIIIKLMIFQDAIQIIIMTQRNLDVVTIKLNKKN